MALFCHRWVNSFHVDHHLEAALSESHHAPTGTFHQPGLWHGRQEESAQETLTEKNSKRL
jgi:hypothetical protein